MRFLLIYSFTALLCLSATPLVAAKKRDKAEKAPPPTSLEQYIEAARGPGQAPQHGPGSTWTPGGAYLDIAADLRARQVNDIVTIIVREQASAVSEGLVEPRIAGECIHRSAGRHPRRQVRSSQPAGG